MTWQEPFSARHEVSSAGQRTYAAQASNASDMCTPPPYAHTCTHTRARTHTHAHNETVVWGRKSCFSSFGPFPELPALTPKWSSRPPGLTESPWRVRAGWGHPGGRGQCQGERDCQPSPSEPGVGPREGGPLSNTGFGQVWIWPSGITGCHFPAASMQRTQSWTKTADGGGWPWPLAQRPPPVRCASHVLEVPWGPLRPGDEVDVNVPSAWRGSPGCHVTQCSWTSSRTTECVQSLRGGGLPQAPGSLRVSELSPLSQEFRLSSSPF